MVSTPEPAIDEPHESCQEYNTPMKACLCGLYVFTDLPKAEIFRRTGVAPRTGYRILKTETSRCEDKFWAGWAPKIDRDIIQKMVKHIKGWYSKRILLWEDLGKECDLDVCDCTIHRAMNKAGYHKCKGMPKGIPFAWNCQKTQGFCWGAWELADGLLEKGRLWTLYIGNPILIWWN